jgi:hypothetical protein
MDKSTQKKISDTLYDTFINIVNEDDFTITKVITLTTSLMQAVDKYTELTGSEKKVIVLYVIERFIEDTNNNTVKDILNTAKPLLPDIIDTIMNVDKRKIKIRAKKLFESIKCC